MDKEKRKASETRAITSDDGKLRKIVGYAAVFDKPSEDMGFIEYGQDYNRIGSTIELNSRQCKPKREPLGLQ